MEMDQDTVAAEVPAAFKRWTKTVFGAPRRPEELITSVEVRDEVIERLATRIRRRAVSEDRRPTAERRSTISKIDPSTVDPFAYNDETLRVESQYIAQCAACYASGRMTCDSCRGTCSMACPTCRGTGKDRSPKTGRPINCKTCKKTGRVGCWKCSGKGSTDCTTCTGSGHQLAWLTFEETERWEVANQPPNSPVFIAHRALVAQRPLAGNDLSEFSVVEEHNANGPIILDDLRQPYRSLPDVGQASVDTRLERIEAQQYVRLAIVRRDVIYEMAGCAGTVVLSGSTLLGARTADAVRPIKRRLWLWAGLTALVAASAALLASQFVGSSAYYKTAQTVAWVLGAFAMACAVPAFGTVLRSWRRGKRSLQFPRLSIAGVGATCVALGAIAAVGLLSRPSPADVRAALAAYNVPAARMRLDALKEFEGQVAVKELEDRVMIAEAAASKSGDERLKLLDAVVARNGGAATDAAIAARNERFAQVRALLAVKDTKRAHQAIAAWFPSDRSPEILEEKARAFDLDLVACSADPCRLAAITNARSAHATPDREAKLAVLRATVLDSLATEHVTEKAALQRLHQVHSIAAAARGTLKHAETIDGEVIARARSAASFAEQERAKVPLIGNTIEVARELLGMNVAGEKNVPSFSLGAALVYLALDAKGRCVGVYVVGTTDTNREIRSETWPAERVLSQALGKKATIKSPARGATTSQWYEAGFPVVARWRSNVVAELRIGNATP